MSWLNYEEAVVAKYNVKLVGWPTELSFEIDGMSASNLQVIVDGFNSGKIKWEHVPLHDRNAEDASIHGSKKRRKQRADKGKKRAPYKKRGVVAPITIQGRSRQAVTSDSSSCSSSSSDESSDSESSISD